MTLGYRGFERSASTSSPLDWFKHRVVPDDFEALFLAAGRRLATGLTNRIRSGRSRDS